MRRRQHGEAAVAVNNAMMQTSGVQRMTKLDTIQTLQEASVLI
jgi:hypothetical protein